MTVAKSLLDRRGFLAKAVSACALTCAAMNGAPALFAAQQTSGQAAAAGKTHKFDNEFQGKLTYRQLFRVQYAMAFIPLVKIMKNSYGREKTIALLKDLAADGVKEQAEMTAKRLGGRDLGTIKKMFSVPELANIWTPEVLEDTDSRYRLRVTECLWADTFRQAGLADEGHAAVCLRDFAFAKALNPQIELTRDKTLMQGQDCCNHCYELKGR